VETSETYLGCRTGRVEGVENYLDCHIHVDTLVSDGTRVNLVVYYKSKERGKESI
jgi:hypothetical protein